MSNILNTLHSQHEMVKGIFKKIEEAEDKSEKEQLFTELKNNLVPHMKGEEKLFYPVLGDMEEHKEEVLHGFEEHHAANLFIKELERMTPGTERWDAKADVLKDMVDHHIETEESKIFAAARESLSDEQLMEIGENFEEMAMKRKKARRLTRVI
jgi:hypothetical protein